MMPTLAPPSVLSAPQRRCQILLTLFQPGLTATMATFSELNGVDEAISVIREYIEIFYNRQRRHSRLGNISPAAFREKYHQMAA
ncbi:hypothetical protein AWZ69_07545 [Shigella sonnei]|nr:hypothetical protein AWZ69_07545 [Shigella sonnei]